MSRKQNNLSVKSMRHGAGVRNSSGGKRNIFFHKKNNGSHRKSSELHSSELDFHIEKKFYQTLMSSSPNIVIGLGVGSKIILFNKFAEKFTGYSAKEVIGKRWIDIFIPACKRKELHGVWAQVVKNKQVGHHHENELVTKYNNEKIIRWTNTLFKDKGKFLMVLSIGEDVTAQRKAETALLMSEEKYKTIVDNTKDIIYAYAPNGKIFFISPNISDLGYSVNEVTGHNILEFVHPDDRKSVLNQFKETMMTGKIFFTNFRLLKKNGSSIFAEEISQIIRQDGKITMLSGVIRDVSERKKAEDELKKSQERFRTASNVLSDVVWEWDIIAKRLDWFGDIDKLLGYAPGKFPRTTSAWKALIHPADYDRVMKALNRHLSKGTPYSQEYRIRKKDRTILFWHDAGMVVRDAHGKAVRMIGSVSDITDRKKAEQQILKSNAFNAALVENAPFGIMTINPSGLVEYVNPTLIDMSGSSQSSFRTMNVFTLPTYVKCGLSVKIKDCFKGKPFFLGPIEYVSHFSSKKTIRNFTGIPMRDADEKIENVMLFIEDLTKQKEEEGELIRKSAFESLISVISVKFLGASINNFNEVMNEVLKMLTEFLEYSRAYVFFFREHSLIMDDAYEWCAKGIEPQIAKLQGIAVDEELPWFGTRIRKDELIIIPDIALLPSGAVKEKKHFQKQGIKSLLVIPLIFGSKTIGFFGFDSVKEKKTCSDADLSVLKLFGSVLSDAIIRYRSEQQLLKSERFSKLQAKETDILNKIVLAGNQAEDLKSLLQIISAAAIGMLDFSGGGIYLRSEGRNLAYLEYSVGLNASFVKAVREINIRAKPFSIVFVEKQPITADDYATYHPGFAKKFHVASLASIPIFSRNEVIGALNIMSRKKHIFSDPEKRTLNAIGRAVGTSIINMQIEENLKARTVELEKFNQLTIGREIRMVELKKKIVELENELTKRVKYEPEVKKKK